MLTSQPTPLKMPLWMDGQTDIDKLGFRNTALTLGGKKQGDNMAMITGRGCEALQFSQNGGTALTGFLLV